MTEENVRFYARAVVVGAAGGEYPQSSFGQGKIASGIFRGVPIVPGFDAVQAIFD